MQLKTQEQIISTWRDSKLPVVSIICLAYNHEHYIKEALESFLLQETLFPFEIIVHDDASTDATADIIKNYANQYPLLIKPIFQTTNVYSQKINPTLIAVTHARGEYIALCEADDFWVETKKLQIQIDAMKANPQCEISFHAAFSQSNISQTTKIIAQHSPKNKIFSTQEVILGGSGFCPTASLIFKKNVFSSLPKWFQDAPVGDYFLQILSAVSGGALYLNQSMSVYRIDLGGSWSDQFAIDADYNYHYFIKMLSSIDDIDQHTQYHHTSSFNIIRRKLCFFMCRNSLLPLTTRQAIFKEHNNKLSCLEKTMWHLFYNNTLLCQWLYKLEKWKRKNFAK